jgi:hypothetical protein
MFFLYFWRLMSNGLRQPPDPPPFLIGWEDLQTVRHLREKLNTTPPSLRKTPTASHATFIFGQLHSPVIIFA